jgi:t-SNARE complex subunit (syntaxin)
MDHQQIIYVGNTSCPLCDALSELDETKKDIKILEKDIDKLAEQYNELMNEVREYAPEILI